VELIKEYGSDIAYFILMGLLAAGLIWSLLKGGG